MVEAIVFIENKTANDIRAQFTSRAETIRVVLVSVKRSIHKASSK